jgi:hypothetical protein
MSDDEYVSQLRESLSVMADDLYWTDDAGVRHYDTQAITEIAAAVGDILREQLKDLPLPDISGRDGKRSYSFKELHLHANLPEKFKFNIETVLDMTKKPHKPYSERMKKPHKGAFSTELYLTTSMKGISARAKNIDFAFEHPKFKEDGIMDVEIPAANLAIDFIFSPNVDTRHPYTDTTMSTGEKTSRYHFLRSRCYFTVSDIIISYHKNTLDHRFLVPFVTRLFKSYIIRNFEAGVERILNERLAMLGERLEKILEHNPKPLSLMHHTFGGKRPKGQKSKDKRRRSSKDLKKEGKEGRGHSSSGEKHGKELPTHAEHPAKTSVK